MINSTEVFVEMGITSELYQIAINFFFIITFFFIAYMVARFIFRTQYSDEDYEEIESVSESGKVPCYIDGEIKEDSLTKEESYNIKDMF